MTEAPAAVGSSGISLAGLTLKRCQERISRYAKCEVIGVLNTYAMLFCERNNEVPHRHGNALLGNDKRCPGASLSDQIGELGFYCGDPDFGKFVHRLNLSSRL